jgi:hypothetical protein
MVSNKIVSVCSVKPNSRELECNKGIESPFVDKEIECEGMSRRKD